MRQLRGGTHTLYLCYFGLREPLVQTQVLPYLRELVGGGVDVSLLTFESAAGQAWSPEAVRERRRQLASEGVRWDWLPYHKRPSLPATMYDIAAGAWFAARLIRREGVDVLHGRGHMGAAIGALARRMAGLGGRVAGAPGPRLLFDIRGFIPEEYVDGGLWPAGGLNYRLTKRAERRLLAAADGFVVLTERAREILFPGCEDTDPRGRPVTVIPCCVDLERFRVADAVSREALRQEMGLSGRRVVVYVGALGGWYLTEEMAEFLATAHAQDPTTFSLILTQSPSESLVAGLKARGLREGDFLVRKVVPAEVPRHLKAADLAVSFIKPCYSKLSSSPTKLAEYLASGLPVVCNAGIGDVDTVIDEDRVGVIVERFDLAAYREALRAADALRHERGIAARCQASAARHFDLQAVGGARYRYLYERLLAKKPNGLARAA